MHKTTKPVWRALANQVLHLLAGLCKRELWSGPHGAEVQTLRPMRHREAMFEGSTAALPDVLRSEALGHHADVGDGTQQLVARSDRLFGCGRIRVHGPGIPEHQVARLATHQALGKLLHHGLVGLHGAVVNQGIALVRDHLIEPQVGAGHNRQSACRRVRREERHKALHGVPALLAPPLIDVPPTADGLSEAVVPRSEDVGAIEGNQQIGGAPDAFEGPTNERQRAHMPQELGLRDTCFSQQPILHAADLFVGCVAPSVRTRSSPSGVLL
mmetsp:Transcript_30339/g.76606  ORF Transcript_30339/g.76606 Transcript_30339/m.76606 type:complete len:270 (-) Transcript_30339:509-1318(-)